MNSEDERVQMKLGAPLPLKETKAKASVTVDSGVLIRSLVSSLFSAVHEDLHVSYSNVLR